MFFAEQNVCQTKLWLTSGFLSPGLQSFLRFPGLGRTHWLVPFPSMWHLGGKGTRSRSATSSHTWWTWRCPKDPENCFRFIIWAWLALISCTSGKAPTCFPRHSGGKKKNSSKQGEKNHTKQQWVWAFLPQPHKSPFFKAEESHALLSD